MPWGMAAQSAAAGLCGAAIVANAALVDGGLAAVPLQSAGAVVVALVASLVLSAELRRQGRVLEAENQRRRGAEARLAQLNAALEERVAARTAELESVIENTTDAIWSVDRAGRVNVINRIARNRLGIHLGAAFTPDSPFRDESARVWKVVRGLHDRAFAGEAVQVELAVEAPDGVRHAQVALHPVRAGDRVVGATVFSRDISQRKRDEQLHRQHQTELAHVQRLGTMGEMAAGLAHEINQPLGAIANFAQGAVRRLQAETVTPAALLPVIEQIAAEALRGGEIIRRLREQMRKDEPHQEALDINALAQASARLLESEARQHSVALDLELAGALPAVAGDPTQIEQVMINLLLNGIEASAGSAGARRVVLRTTTESGAVAVAVSDNGAGLPGPPADVFAPFFTTKRHGLGMGLSISRSIIEAHGGRLEALPADAGATFRFTLPAAWRGGHGVFGGSAESLGGDSACGAGVRRA